MANPGPAAPLPCSGSEQVIPNETIRIGGRFRPEGNDMKPRRLALEAGQWYGWQEVPVPHPGWGASPVYLIDAEPLKTGKGILRLSFIQALHPVCATKRSIDLRVGVQTPGAIAGSFVAADGTVGTATISVADIDWIKGYSPQLWRQRPPRPPGFVIVGEPPRVVTPSGYLNATLGSDEARILLGATRQKFRMQASRDAEADCDLRPGPDRRTVRLLAYRTRLVPEVMEEKWFIYLESGHLFFRRSWTGNLIYTVEAEWQGDCLHLGQATVNRNPGQYSETDDAYDRLVLIFLIRAVMLGLPASFPAKDGMDPAQAALQGWSTAGNGSL
jgi:hypothetical protein